MDSKDSQPQFKSFFAPLNVYVWTKSEMEREGYKNFLIEAIDLHIEVGTSALN